MTCPAQIRPVRAELYFLPVETRVPLKFGPETLTSVVCARVSLAVVDNAGRESVGWGETPLSVQWVWPSALPYAERLASLQSFCRRLVASWAACDWSPPGHALEIGHAFLEDVLPGLLARFNQEERPGQEPMPRLAALVCTSAFDLALHDAASGAAAGLPIYSLYNRANLASADLSRFLQPEPDSSVSFEGRYPSDFLASSPPRQLPAWHLVGGLDPLEASDITGSEPDDGHPVLLRDWIRRDGLKCLKIKLRGNDLDWDFERLAHVGRIAAEEGVDWLSADFNCTVDDPYYVNLVLDWLLRRHPRTYGMILYVEQPFPYDLEEHRLDVRSVSARKPLFMDESAHDWRLVSLGRSLGWTGVALKTCKTQTGALLSLCWARAHGMTLMVQDLTNPMLAQIPHVLLAAHARTIMGVETNGMQFYPAASAPEAAVHPDLYQRRQGMVDWATVDGAGFGYRLDEIDRQLPPPDTIAGS
jgi:L-alanine-DL-glutamate epimerase-like enolase superfamily enzyme